MELLQHFLLTTFIILNSIGVSCSFRVENY